MLINHSVAAVLVVVSWIGSSGCWTILLVLVLIVPTVISPPCSLLMRTVGPPSAAASGAIAPIATALMAVAHSAILGSSPALLDPLWPAARVADQ